MSKIKQSIVKYIAAFLMLALTPIYAKLTGSQTVWETNVTIDEFTDKKITVASIFSIEENHTNLISLVCYPSRSFSGRILFDTYLGARRIDVMYRVDKNEPATLTMRAVPMKTRHRRVTVVYFNDIDSKFVRDLMNGKGTVLVKLIPHDGYASEPRTVRFTLNGSTAAIKTVLEACGKK